MKNLLFLVLSCYPRCLCSLPPLNLSQWGDIAIILSILQSRLLCRGSVSDEREQEVLEAEGCFLRGELYPNTPLWLFVSTRDGWIDGPLYLLRRCTRFLYGIFFFLFLFNYLRFVLFKSIYCTSPNWQQPLLNCRYEGQSQQTGSESGCPRSPFSNPEISGQEGLVWREYRVGECLTPKVTGGCAVRAGTT